MNIKLNVILTNIKILQIEGKKRAERYFIEGVLPGLASQRRRRSASARAAHKDIYTRWADDVTFDDVLTTINLYIYKYLNRFVDGKLTNIYTNSESPRDTPHRYSLGTYMYMYRQFTSIRWTEDSKITNYDKLTSMLRVHCSLIDTSTIIISHRIAFSIQ